MAQAFYVIECQQQDGEDTGKAELFTQARQDVVAFGHRGQLGPALTEARADEAALREAEDALHELVAAAGRVDHGGVEGVQPGREPGGR